MMTQQQLALPQFDLLVDSGRSALRLALCSIPRRTSVVLVQEPTCSVVFDVIRHCGFRPIGFEEGPPSLPSDAVIATQPCDMTQFVDVPTVLIEDSARYCPAGYRGEGDFTIFSFGWGKPICVGGGGALNVKEDVRREYWVSMPLKEGPFLKPRVKGLMYVKPIYNFLARHLTVNTKYDNHFPTLMNPNLVKLLRKKISES